MAKAASKKIVRPESGVEPLTKVVTFRLSERHFGLLAEKARRERRYKSDMARILVEQALEGGN